MNLAPNGKPSNLTPEQYRLVRTPAFISWFGDWENDSENASKVVDENGEPMVVYHNPSYGDCNENIKYPFTVFDIEQKFEKTKINTPTGKSFYFALDLSTAGFFSNCSQDVFLKKVYRCFLNVRNPSNNQNNAFSFDDLKHINLSIKDTKYSDGTYLHNYDLESANEDGWDGIGDADQIIVFNSNQIKLADGSNTTFDGSNPDIRFDDGGVVTAKEAVQNKLKNVIVIGYHGTTKLSAEKIKQGGFKIMSNDVLGVHFGGDKKYAYSHYGQVIIAEIKLKNPIYQTDYFKEYDNLLLRGFKQPDGKTSQKEFINELKRVLLSKGYDGVIFTNEIIVINPTKENIKIIDGSNPDIRFGDGGGIPERYKNMGFTKVGQKRKSTIPSKKWMVLARKGDKYKIVHGGYKGMQDYSQHHDEVRRKRFWNRMGGFDSAKANDSFSPLYWHKKFGTWEDGGEIGEITSKELSYPSGSSLDYYNGKIYLTGDDARYISILDTDFNEIDGIPLFDHNQARIPKKEKRDIETSCLVNINGQDTLLLFGSGSRTKRKKLFLIPLDTEEVLEAEDSTEPKDSVFIGKFIGKLYENGIDDVNIEGSTTTRTHLLLSNRGNKTNPDNFIIATEKDFWTNRHPKITITKLDLPKGLGMSEMTYDPEKDVLFFTASVENTSNSFDDGNIGDSFIGYVLNITSKLSSGDSVNTITPDKLINLPEYDKVFEGHKIEGICLEDYENGYIIDLVSDNDDGKSTMFKMRLEDIYHEAEWNNAGWGFDQAANGKEISDDGTGVIYTPEFKKWFGYWDLIPDKARKYSEPGVREITHGIRNGDENAISTAADFLSIQVTSDDVLIPIPNRTGGHSYANSLSKAISERTGAKVFGGLRGKERPSVYEMKKKGADPKSLDFGFYIDGEIPPAKNYFVVDNVIGTGTTMLNAQKAVGHNAQPLVYSADERFVGNGGGSVQELNILYLHGLDATPESDRAEILNKNGVNIIAPHLTYENGSLFEQLSDIIKNENIKGIVGHSYGGYFAYCLSNKFRIPCLMLTPYFGDKNSLHPIPEQGIPYPRQILLIGSKDEMFIPSEQMKLFKESGCEIFTEDTGHDIPDDIKIKYFDKFITEFSGAADGSILDSGGWKSIKGMDTIGREIPNWDNAIVYHSTDTESAKNIRKIGYKILGNGEQAGYYGIAVSFTPDIEYTKNFGETTTIAKVKKGANILNLNDDNDWQKWLKIIKDANANIRKFRSSAIENKVDGVYDPGAGDLFIYNTDVIEVVKAEDGAKISSLIPLIVYHGTDKEYDILDKKHLGSSYGATPSNMMGFFFTDNQNVAKTYGKNVKAYKITIKSPYVVDAKGSDYSNFKHKLNEIAEKINRSKYDGIIIKNYGDAGIYSKDTIVSNNYIVFDLHQITKIAENGTEIMDEETYLAINGASRQGFGDSALHKNRGGASDKAWTKIVDAQAKKDRDLMDLREKLRAEYNEKVAKGEIRPPSHMEKLISTAQGNPDREDVQAARRLLTKRGISWDK